MPPRCIAIPPRQGNLQRTTQLLQLTKTIKFKSTVRGCQSLAYLAVRMHKTLPGPLDKCLLRVRLVLTFTSAHVQNMFFFPSRQKNYYSLMIDLYTQD